MKIISNHGNVLSNFTCYLRLLTMAGKMSIESITSCIFTRIQPYHLMNKAEAKILNLYRRLIVEVLQILEILNFNIVRFLDTGKLF